MWQTAGIELDLNTINSFIMTPNLMPGFVLINLTSCIIYTLPILYLPAHPFSLRPLSLPFPLTYKSTHLTLPTPKITGLNQNTTEPTTHHLPHHAPDKIVGTLDMADRNRSPDCYP